MPTMKQIYLFTGENSFDLREKKTVWLTQFAQKHGEENISRMYAKDVTIRSLLDEIAVAPFIAQKRLIVLYGIPKCSKEDMEHIQKCIHPDVLLLIVEPKLDKRLSSTKELLNCAEVQECTPLKGSQLTQWMQGYASMLHASLSPEAQKALLEMVGENQDLLAQEMHKLALYKHGQTIEAEDIRESVLFAGEQQIWGLMDLLGQKKEKEALAYVHMLLRQGESAHGVWSILLWMMASLVSVVSAVEEGITSPAAIVKQCGVSFGSAKALLPIARQCKKQQVNDLLDRIVAYDMSLKTGGYKATEQEPQELHALLDRTVLACCSFG